MLSNINLYFWQPEKLILEKKRKIIKQKKKNNYQLCKKRMCTATYVLKHSWRYFLRSKSLKPAVGTWIQYLLDGDTFDHTYSMLCTWSSVAYNLYFIVIKYKFTNFGQQNKFFLKKKKKNKQKIIIKSTRNVHVLRHTLWTMFKHYFVRLKSLKL